MLRSEIEREKFGRDDDLSLAMTRRRRTGSTRLDRNSSSICFSRLEQDRLQMENEYLLQQQMLLSKSSPLNEIVQFKKELDKSERQREQLSDHLEVRSTFSSSLFPRSLTFR